MRKPALIVAALAAAALLTLALGPARSVPKVEAASKSDFITSHRQGVTRLIDALNNLQNLRRQYDALGYANATTGITDADFTGANADLTAAEFKAGVAAAANLNTAFTSGGTFSGGIDANLFRQKLGS
ncbi:MAG TPA: hypothetical protein VD948_12985 [Rhodothermales bacterium]|nr:hypothetical protein [Rhodothermales bacterium]